MQHQFVVSEALEARRLLSASLFKDINATQAAPDGTGTMVSAGAVNYFSQDDGANGYELWKTDGTAAGTVLIKDINPGPADSQAFWLTMVGNTVFFTANDGTNGAGIWKSDGTATGTQLVKAVQPGSGTAGRRPIWAFNGAIYFGVIEPGLNSKLWRSDGTTAGTVAIKDLPASGSTGVPENFVVNNGALFFTTTNQLWKTDGTTAGTTLVKAISAGGSGTIAITSANGFVYLSASDGVSGYELWKSDGTAANTVMVKDIVAGSTSSFPSNFVTSGNLAYFSTSSGPSGVWRTDGTAAGTFALGTASTSYKFDLGGTLFCMIGTTLQKTTGTTLTVVKSGLTSAFNFAAVNGFLYFQANDGTGAGVELWRTNGTTTTLVKDIISGSASSSPGRITPIGSTGSFMFTAQAAGLGGSLYKSDGSSAGTVFVKDVYPATNDSYPRDMAVFNNAMYFSADDGINGGELWKTDGTLAGTVLVKDIVPASSGSYPSDLTVLGPSKLFFRATESSTGYEPYITDGTAAGTKLIKDINSGFSGSAGNASDVVSLNGLAYFFAHDGVNGEELWRSDGTATGTIRLSNINPNLGTKLIDDRLWAMDNAVYFVADNYLWRSDGTVNGTARVTATVTVSSNTIGVFNHSLFFGGTPASTFESELWISDGTSTGTRSFIDLNGLPAGSSPDYFMPIGDKMVFGAQTASNGYELFVTDGTGSVGSTALVKDLNPGAASGFTPNPSSGFVAANGVAYFSATDGTHGVELWRSDGTAAGTYLVKDTVPGSSGSGVTGLAAFNGYAYFVGTDGPHGIEAWRTDGTTAGTAMVADLRVNNDGALGYDPEGFTAFNGDVYFSATDEVHGKELFRDDAPTFAVVAGNVLTISGTGGDDVIDVTLFGGTYTITLNGVARSFAAASFSSIVVNGLTGDDLLRTNDATGRPITFNGAAGNNTIEVRSGIATFNSDVRTASEAVNLTVRAGAAARFGSTQHIAELRIESGASATMLQNGGRMLFADWLEIVNAGHLDLVDNDLVVHSQYVPVDAYIFLAYNFGDWDGPGGIFSSAAKTNPRGNTTLGMLPAWEFQSNNGGLFNGYAPADNDILVKYTYFGDVDFNGRVDVSDYNLIDYGFYLNAGGWSNGDADYSGEVDASDYNVIDFAFSTQSGVL